MVGLQSVSVIATPPARRQPIRTAVETWADATVRATLLREKGRGGQSFVVVPRIEDMPAVAKAAHAVVQEAINAGVLVCTGGLEDQRVSIVTTDGFAPEQVRSPRAVRRRRPVAHRGGPARPAAVRRAGGGGRSALRGSRDARDQLEDGEHVERHRDGSVRARGPVVAGRPDGYWEWFRLDGTKLRSGSFAAGEPVGEWTTYDRTGAPYKTTVRS